jgi:hypothetical protein
MAKTHKLSTQWDVTGGNLSITVEARDPAASKDAAAIGSFKRSLGLASVFGAGYSALNEAGQAALEFGAFTALRNCTGSCDTLEEAETALDRRLEAFNAGEWGAAREGSAVPFTATHALALAIERASKGAQTADQAAERLSALTHDACAANSLPAFASMESTDRAKLRRQIIDSILKTKPVIAAAFAQVEAEAQAAAAERKAAAARKALEAAESDDSGATI